MKLTLCAYYCRLLLLLQIIGIGMNVIARIAVAAKTLNT